MSLLPRLLLIPRNKTDTEQKKVLVYSFNDFLRFCKNHFSHQNFAGYTAFLRKKLMTSKIHVIHISQILAIYVLTPSTKFAYL